MRDSRFEELISAYFDGELSSEERALVERELSQSDESRQLYEQLKSQHRLLQALPRHRLSRDLAATVQQRLEQELGLPHAPAAEVTVVLTSRRRKVLNVALAMVATVAATLLITTLVRNSGGPSDIVEAANDLHVTPELVDQYRRTFSFVLTYDLIVTPEGQKNQVFEKSLAAAGIEFETVVPIENRLEKRILEAQFIGPDQIVAGGDGARDDVEVVFLRATGGQMETLWRQLNSYEETLGDQLTKRMNLVLAPKELEIFININRAIDRKTNDRGTNGGSASMESWSTPGAYRLQFPDPLHTRRMPQISSTPRPVRITQVAGQGDVNGDGAITPEDSVELIKYLNEAEAKRERTAAALKSNLLLAQPDVTEDKANRLPVTSETKAGTAEQPSVPAVPKMSVEDLGANRMGVDMPAQILVIIRNLRPNDAQAAAGN